MSSCHQEDKEEDKENGVVLKETKNDSENNSRRIQEFTLSSISLEFWLPFTFSLSSSLAFIFTTCAPTHVSEVLHYIFFGFFLFLSLCIIIYFYFILYFLF